MVFLCYISRERGGLGGSCLITGPKLVSGSPFPPLFPLPGEKVVGIDLGTTNSAIAVMEGGDPQIVPNQCLCCSQDPPALEGIQGGGGPAGIRQ